LLAKIESVALVGTEARPVQVEVFVGQGVPAFRIVGLPSASVREAEQRVRGALEESSERWPPHKIVANLAPGALRKEGTHFDLAIALGIVAADKRLDPAVLDRVIAIGELALDGTVRPVRGTVAAAITCRELGGRKLICPRRNAHEAVLIDGLEVLPVDNLGQCLAYLRGKCDLPRVERVSESESPVTEDLAEVRGNWQARRALEVAAAGGHNLLLEGPPGGGKTMLARRLPGILPPMNDVESLEVTRVYSVAGLLPERATLLRNRPFRAPHHNVSLAGLIGGGSGLARPGEISLAHRGVLFLDEVGLYRRELLDTLRAPIEDGTVRIVRSAGVVTYPCTFSLIAAMNPCPCGFMNDSFRDCRCEAYVVERCQRKLSGPVLDRFDMRVAVDRLTRAEITDGSTSESSAAVRSRVIQARLIQDNRYDTATTNATAPVSVEGVITSLGRDSFLCDQIDNGVLSGRGLVRTWKVARTIADLEGADRVTENHVLEALSLKFDGFKEENVA
jgi:magnesium chelatase family protein